MQLNTSHVHEASPSFGCVCSGCQGGILIFQISTQLPSSSTTDVYNSVSSLVRYNCPKLLVTIVSIVMHFVDTVDFIYGKMKRIRDGREMKYGRP